MSRQMSALALMLMLLTIGLLVAPSTFHRISQDGQSTGRTHGLIGCFATLALLPLAAALGLDLTLTLIDTGGVDLADRQDLARQRPSMASARTRRSMPASSKCSRKPE